MIKIYVEKSSNNYCERNRKYYKYPKGKKQRNLNVLDVNGKMLSENKMLMN